MRQYNAFYATEFKKAYTAAVALINEHSGMFTSEDFAIFLGLPDDKVTPAHFQRVVELLPRLQGPLNPPDLVERATALQRVMLEQCNKMPPNEQILCLLEEINVIKCGLTRRQCPFL